MTACICATCNRNRATWNAAAERTAAGISPMYSAPPLPDVETLERSRLSMHAARAQRRPVRLVVDEGGWGNDGRYHPEYDGAA